MPGLFERVGGWRAVVTGVRVLAAAALILGIGRGLPVAFVDLDLRYSLPLPLGVTDLIAWWDLVGEQQASAVVLAAAAAAVAGTAYRKGILDGASLALVALAWAFAFLPEGVVFVGMRSPAMDGVLVVGFAGAVLGLASGRLTPTGYGVVFCLLATMALVALQALLADAVRDRAPEIAAVAAAVALALVAITAYRYLPWATWHVRLPGTSVRLVTLAVMPCVIAVGPLLAARAGQATAALALAGLLAATLLVYGAIVLALRVRAPLRLGGDVDVDRPPERVFRELTDVHTPLAAGAPRRALETLDDHPVGVGSRLRYRTTQGHIETVTVTTFDAPAVFEYELAPASYRSRIWFAIEPREGGSRVHWRHRLDVPVYWRMRASYRRTMERALDETARRLRAGRRFVDDEAAEPSVSPG